MRDIKKEYQTEQASEHSFRHSLKRLIESFDEDIIAQDEARSSGRGIPDFTVRINNTDVGYIETKNLNKELDPTSAQVRKYSNKIPNVLLTDFLRFILIRNGDIIIDLRLLKFDEFQKSKHRISNENIQKFDELLSSFFLFKRLHKITTSRDLSGQLTKIASRIKQYGVTALVKDKENKDNNNYTPTPIWIFYHGIVHMMGDLDNNEVASAYAETITYGMFLAKLDAGHKKLERATVSTFIPQSLEVIRALFNGISKNDMPPDLKGCLDDAIHILNSTDIVKLKSEFEASDPFTHFYEDFISKYDPRRKKIKGVFLTPKPVVDFITKSINIILKQKFSKSLGLGDSDVIVLDPAIGTGTFLVNAIELALAENQRIMPDGNQALIREHILKHFLGFEIMIPPYIISHIKVNIFLKKYDYELLNERAKIYLTNAIDISEYDTSVFYDSLTPELRQANDVKNNVPVMVVFGNPPYSLNHKPPIHTDWINNLLTEYKKGLNEQRHGILDDDYVKFIRMAQQKIVNNGFGIVGYITNNSFLDGAVCRKMRESLFADFNYLYFYNLRGGQFDVQENADDENVFDIRQGVSIMILIKTENSREHNAFYAEIVGSRTFKYKTLSENNVSKIKFEKITPTHPNYYFIPMNHDSAYEKYYDIRDIFEENISGILTKRDDLAIDRDAESLFAKIKKFADLSSNEIEKKFGIKDTMIKVPGLTTRRPEFSVKEAKKQLTKEGVNIKKIVNINYRPFDKRTIYFSDHIVARTRISSKSNLVNDNYCLCFPRQSKTRVFSSILVSKGIAECKYADNSTIISMYPLKFDPDPHVKQNTQSQLFDSDKHLISYNFKRTFVDFIIEKYGKQVTGEDIFYYIYAVLYSKLFRKKYSSFLKTSYPKIPFNDYQSFKKLSKLGSKLVKCHLMESAPRTVLTVSGDDYRAISSKIKFVKDKLYINKKTYFQGMTKDVWNFDIGGYKIIMNLLKKRGCVNIRDVQHIIKVDAAIRETFDLQNEIDGIFRKIKY